MNEELDPLWGGLAVAVVVVATLAISTWGLRISRTTSDFFVASRRVRVRTNASAIGGEYVSAASFLGVAGLVLAYGAEMLWYPVGWTAGYLVLLALVAAPLRRSGAYTLPDFAEARLASERVRTLCALLVVAIGWLYLVPQFQGAGITLAAVTGVPRWVGGPVVALVVLAGVASGGMRSITVVQAFQYWLKLTALLAPLAVLVVIWAGDGRPLPADLATGVGDASWSTPFGGGLTGLADGPVGLYLTYSVIVATFLGAMGLPHVVVRFYTNPDGRAARRTTLGVLGLLGLFYLLPPVYGALGRVYGTSVGPREADTLVLHLPGLMTDGVLADALSAVITAGAFAAFLSTSSGLTIAVAGVLSQALTRRGVPAAGVRAGGVRAVASARRTDPVTMFRVGAVLAVTIPCLAALAAPGLPVARSVGLAFAVAASTFCPLLVLGIWWRGLTAAGALAGLVAGGVGSGTGVVASLALDGDAASWGAALVAQPAAWSVPLAFAVMVGVSLATRSRVPAGVDRFMVRLHTPEDVELDRG